MIAWLISKLAKPVLPLLLQTQKVVAAVESTLKTVLVKATELGVGTDTPIYNEIKQTLDAVTVIKSAVEKAITFLGGVVPTTTQTNTLSLTKEIEELKKLL